MADDGPVLSAFAARKRLLARSNEPRSFSTTDYESGRRAGGAEGGGDSSDAPPENGIQKKRTSRRRKRQRVEKASGQEQEQEVTIGLEPAPDTLRGDSRRSTPKPDVVEEPGQPPTQTSMASTPRAEMDVVEETNTLESLALESEEPGAFLETTARKKPAPTTLARELSTGPLPPFAAKDVIRNSITLAGNGVVELRVDQEERLRLPIVGQYGVRVIRGELCGPEDLPKKSVFRPLYSPPEWNKKLAELADTAKPAPIFVCGPKGSGKSTFSRLLTNRLLTQALPQKGKARVPDRGVLLLDIDPGQPEFCPAGTISLVLVHKPNISPPFAHPWPNDGSSTLIRCHALASVSPGSDPDRYAECALDLYSQYQRNWNGYPLVVNTPGWILGTGLDLLGLVIGRIRPSEVVYMSEDGPAETVDGLQHACKRTSSFSTLPSQQSDSGARKTAAQLRAMQTMAYFHSQGTTNTGHMSWNSSPLSTVPPWRVKYTGSNRGFVGVMCYGDQPNPSLLAEAINGMVLAAVEIEDERALGREPEDTSMDVDVSERRMLHSLEGLIRRTPEGIPYFQQSEGEILDPAYSRTIGLVLVRGVDVENAALQILTPIPLPALQEIRQNGRHVVFVHGQFDAPTWAYTEDLYEREFRVDEEDEDGSDEEDDPAARSVNRPWVEGVDERRRRLAGAGTWRVRRDLGKQNR